MSDRRRPSPPEHGRPTLRPAREGDIPQIELLLSAEGLPPYQIREHLETFFVLEEGGRAVGSAGLEVYGEAAMLRSVVVAPELRGGRQGRRLTEAALAEARRRGVQRVYLFTMHAASFFARYGFRECRLEDFEPAVRQSFQYRGVSTMPQLRQMLHAMRLEFDNG
ncbi:MAG: GNAT family N-acetyltransferase [Chloroflexi bacterium]|nr:GNAT family N-acetyltransferase [Chloroflexota bacterium]